MAKDEDLGPEEVFPSVPSWQLLPDSTEEATTLLTHSKILSCCSLDTFCQSCN